MIIPDVNGMDVRDGAVELRNAGVVVFPWNPKSGNGKNLGNVWGRGYLERAADTTADVLSQWYQDNPTVTGLAICPGYSGLVALDVDHPANIRPELRDMLGDLKPPMQRSRRESVGGVDRGHYFFLVPEGQRVGNPAWWLGDGCGEVKSWRAGVACAPGDHSSGGRYEWVRAGKVPLMPEEFARTLPEPRALSGAAVDREAYERFVSDHNELGGFVPVWFLTEYRKVLRRMEDQTTAGGGGRHNELVAVSVAWFRKSVRGLVNATDVDTALTHLFDACWDKSEEETESIRTYAVGQVLTESEEE